MSKPLLRDQIASLQHTIRCYNEDNASIKLENERLRNRIQQISADNETLLADKKWLKLLIQNLLEIIQRSSIKER